MDLNGCVTLLPVKKTSKRNRKSCKNLFLYRIFAS